MTEAQLEAQWQSSLSINGKAESLDEELWFGILGFTVRKQAVYLVYCIPFPSDGCHPLQGKPV